VSVNWRSRQVIDGKTIDGALELLEADGTRVDVPDAIFANLLSGSVADVSAKQRLKSELAGANNVTQVKAVIDQLIDELVR
jgi:hypothetical protein